jgi:hypothetical protein
VINLTTIDGGITWQLPASEAAKIEKPVKQ